LRVLGLGGGEQDLVTIVGTHDLGAVTSELSSVVCVHMSKYVTILILRMLQLVSLVKMVSIYLKTGML